MRILVVHNRYLQPGGEDQVFAAEVALLQQHGHDVNMWVEDNALLEEQPALVAAANTIWSRQSQRHLQQLLHELKPEVVHFHNTFLRISPAVYYTCRQAGIPVVQTLHNYRLLCPAATFYRDGHICEECLGNLGYWPSVVHGCWRSSRPQSAVVAAMLALHRTLQTWERQVDLFVALTEFARQKYIQGGLPANKIVVKPNFLALPINQPEPGCLPYERYALFVGRLSSEKGVDALLTAWQSLPDVPLRMVGDGPLLPRLEEQVRYNRLTQVQLCGRRSHAEVLQLMRHAQFLVFSSTWYEGFPMTILEAFACGLPVVASRIGSIVELVEEGKTGLAYAVGDLQELATQVRWAWEHPVEMLAMGQNAQQVYLEKYGPETNYQLLLDIYRRAQAEPRA